MAASSSRAPDQRLAWDILQHLPDATVVVDGGGVLRWMNPSAERALGASAPELLGESALSLIHPDDLQQVLLALGSVQGKDVGTAIEVRIRTGDGWRLAEAIGAPLGDGEGSVVLTLRDLTERRRWEVAGDENAKLRTLVHHSPSLLFLVDAAGCVVASSGAVTRLLGHDQADVEHQPLAALVVDADRDVLDAAIRRALVRPVVSPASGETARVQVRLRDRDGTRAVPYELSVVDLLDDPTVGSLVVTGHDVSERTAAEDDLRTMLSLLEATLDATDDGILVVDLDGRITSCNSRFVDLWSLPEQLIRDGDDGAAIAHAKDQLLDPETFVSGTAARYQEVDVDSFDLLEFCDGRIVERRSTPQCVAGEVVGRVWSFREVTRQKELESELAHQAFHDPLTGLANQALFRDRVGHALQRAERDGVDVAVLYLDLDDFKRVNDSLGHPVGDELLLAVGERLRSCLRSTDTAARLGGDEFAILIEAPRDAGTLAAAVARRVRDLLTEPITVGDRDLVTSVSTGIACQSPGISTDQLLRNADLAMYAAKRGGKGGFRRFATRMHAAALARLEVEADLRSASITGDFHLRYQPIVELATGRVAGAEALVRWQHPLHGEVAPDHFIDAAEDIGLIVPLGRHVLELALAQAEAWSSSGSLSVSVNVSPRQLVGGQVVHQVRDALARTTVAPERLVVELTETAMMQDTRSAAATLGELRAMGVRIALDDFGTGFSSLTHLQRFPIDLIKIDRSFVAASEGHGRSLVRAVLAMCDELGLTAVAEGVETAEQVAFLQDAGCPLAQGYFFSRPELPEALVGLVGHGIVVPTS